MSILRWLLRRIVFVIDAILRRVYGVWEFTQDPDCIFRVSTARSTITMLLPDGVVLHKGDPVGVIHIWNERVAPPDGQIDLRWARVLLRRTRHSFRLLAECAQQDPRLRNAVAFGGETSMFSAQALGRPEDFLAFLGMGYAPVEAKGCLHRLRLFFDRFYGWLLLFAYNPATLRGKSLANVGRGYAWMSRARLMKYAAPTAENQR